MTNYLLAGGGTAGHVNPLLAVADRLRRNEPDASILALGTAQGLEARLVPDRGYELFQIDRLPFPRRLDRAAFAFPKNFGRIVRNIESVLVSRNIDAVVGFGGYVSAPAYIAARRARLPIVIHEANAKAGLANRLGSLVTRFVGITFAGTRLRNSQLVGMPLRLEIESLDRHAMRADALTHFDLDSAKPTLLVTGGSLGAARLNETISESSAQILGAGWQILHIAGERAELPRSELAGYKLLDYCDRMELAFAAADLAIARAGSVTVSELTAVGIPAVYVPLAIGNGEQRLNAKGVVDAGGAVVVENAIFNRSWVNQSLVPLLQDRAEIARMAGISLQFGVRDGTDRMIRLISEATSAG